jgi:hypothetical protein
VQFALYAREARHYSLNMALSLALILAFLRLPQHPRDPWFAVCAVLLYHCQPLPGGVSLAALGALTLVHPRFAPMRTAFWLRLPIILVLTLPWTILAWSGVSENSSLLADPREVLPRFGQFAAEATAAIPVVGWAILIPLVRRSLSREDRTWLALAGALIVAYALMTPLLLSARQLWEFGLRYSCALLPIAAGVTGVLVARASRDRSLVLASLVLLFALTHLPGSTLAWMVVREGAEPDPRAVAMHVPRQLLHKLVRVECPAYLAELRSPTPGTVSHIVEFLREHAEPGDVVVTNYAWEPIYFHTGLPQGFTVMPDYPIYEAARSHDLPEYVFGVEQARWLIWRFVWEGYVGYDYHEITDAFARSGAQLRPVAIFEETIWENRPELAFHRVPGLGHLFPGSWEFFDLDSISGAIVYRVNRPPHRGSP